MSPSSPSPQAPPRPLFIRVPRSGERCPYTGMARSSLLTLILPSRTNGFSPPVASIVVRKPGRARGIRLIHWASLDDYIRSCPAGRNAAEPTKAARAAA